ncbi:MAG: hypothetical protein KDK99_21390, partial [Verrucomicrobiales bacterium]|nr:hypothetical protein [Verrucomicrobiales bacterium]
MIDGFLFFLSKQLILLLVAAILFTWLGWWLRCKLCKCGATAEELSEARSRLTGLESDLKDARAQASRAESKLAEAEKGRIDPAELAEARRQLDAATADANSLRTQAQKAREQLDAANARATEAGKKPQERVYQLEGEVSKLREELARARSGQTAAPVTADASAEVAKLKQSLSVATAEFGRAQRERDTFKAELDRLRGEPQSAPTRSAPASSGKAAGPNPEAARLLVRGLQGNRPKAAAAPKPVAAEPEETPPPAGVGTLNPEALSAAAEEAKAAAEAKAA